MKTTEKRMGQILSILYFLKKISLNAEKAKPNSLAISFFFKRNLNFGGKLSSISWFNFELWSCGVIHDLPKTVI